IIVEDLETDPKLQDAVLSVFHAASHSLSATPLLKVIENQNGKSYLKQQPQQQQIVMQLPKGLPFGLPPQLQPQPPQVPTPIVPPAPSPPTATP
ncbi:MAG TPA: hypothetical protein VH853_23125, partial [Polyangia bacterium]|nr:hypothetical protein [Polyangia bacterium]